MSTENLSDQKAVEKLREMVDKIDIGMLCTHTNDEKHIHAVPMSRQEVDGEGNAWYLFSSESETYRHLQHDSTVCLLYSDPGSYSFLSIHADTEVSTDEARIDKYWSKMVEGWFEKGRSDPRIRVLKVIPLEAHYWDNKTNKLVTLFKVALSGISGQKLDIGRSGDLKF